MKKIMLIIILFASVAFASHLPQPTGYVSDFAGILTDTAGLESELRAYEQNTTIEIAVVTISNLPPDQTLFSYGVELFEEWGIGKRGEDNGILVLINKENAPGNRLRIELGYGIQGYITGAEAGQILDNALPYYEQGDYQLAAEIILNGLSEELADYVPGQEPPDDFGLSSDVYMFVIPFFLLWLGLPLFSAYFSVEDKKCRKSLRPIFLILPAVIAVIIVNVFIGFFLAIAVFFALIIFMSGRCPRCGSRKIKCTEHGCTCQKCGKKFKSRRSGSGWILAGAGGFSGGGGGGGFGGGGSGGGGAGR
ncbi:MAG: hypothetical protein QT00_C0001G0294 [archaeon GW2011_AR5]|nr:MAG: hypothetical protein QT00_C0001G0294 [archaeon GW2011_AR5]